MRDAIDRVRVELEVSGITTAFVGPTFTMAELRAVYEAIWGVQLDAANFRRSIVAEDGWVIPTGRRAQPGTAGGRPGLYRAGRAWQRGGPIHLRAEGSEHEAVVRPVRTAAGHGLEDVRVRFEEGGRCWSRCTRRPSRGATAASARPIRFSPASSPGCSARNGGSRAWSSPGGGSRWRGAEFDVGDEVFGIGAAPTPSTSVREQGALAHKPAGMSWEEAAAT